MKIRQRHVGWTMILIALVLIGLEIALSLLAFISPRVQQLLASPWAPSGMPHTVPDTHLGYRPNPAYPGHDRQGFRNPCVPGKAHIVALGDSQTYGTGVEPAEAWPRQLEAMTDNAVYSMAYGGYGPTHSLMLWEEATAREPDVVIEAFYAGNDLFESFNFVYNRGKLPELKSADHDFQRRVRDAERAEPIAKRVAVLFNMGAERTNRQSAASGVKANPFSPRKIMSAYSKLYGLLRRMQYESVRLVRQLNDSEGQWGQAKAFAAAHPAYCEVFQHGAFKTILTSPYRLTALDLDDPRIAEGLQISWRAIRIMHEQAAAKNVRFFVLLVPTKEAVFHGLRPHASVQHHQLIAQEARFLAMSKAYFTQHGIEYLDALPALQEQFEAGVQPYAMSADGHPNRHGHRAIAKLVAQYLASSAEPHEKP